MGPLAGAGAARYSDEDVGSAREEGNCSPSAAATAAEGVATGTGERCPSL